MDTLVCLRIQQEWALVQNVGYMWNSGPYMTFIASQILFGVMNEDDLLGRYLSYN